jgi:hypothetical protein
LVFRYTQKESHISHFTLDEAVAMVQELKVPTGFFTHISHQLGRHKDVNAALPAGIKLANDGLQLFFEQKGRKTSLFSGVFPAFFRCFSRFFPMFFPWIGCCG